MRRVARAARLQVALQCIGVEVYVDVSDAWQRDPKRIANVKPLEL
jgi:hypothetical protein